jgi:hypothetical protein
MLCSSYLKFRAMKKDLKPSDSECYTPSSETSGFYLIRTDVVLMEGNFGVCGQSPILSHIKGGRSEQCQDSVKFD